MTETTFTVLNAIVAVLIVDRFLGVFDAFGLVLGLHQQQRGRFGGALQWLAAVAAGGLLAAGVLL
jgi:hypothetical protein